MAFIKGTGHLSQVSNLSLLRLDSKMVEHYKKWNMEVADLDEVKQSFLKAVSANNRKVNHSSTTTLDR
jgi:hypothetical protein